MKLSISGYKRWTTCPKQFEIHYIDKNRPEQTTSALSFGTAIDDALNDLVVNRDLDGAKKIFVDNFEMDHTNTMCDPKDYDPLLVSEEQKEMLLNDAQEVGYKGDDFDELMVDLFKIQGRNGLYFDKMSENQKAAIVYGCMVSLQEKAMLILDTYYDEILPRLSDVKGVQSELLDKDGSVGGLPDLFAVVDGGEQFLLDNKTAKNKYSKYHVDSSIQLKLYAHLSGVYNVGYIVAHKDIKHYKSRPSKADIQFITFSVDPDECAMVYSTVIETRKHAMNGVFPKNLNACHSIFGRPCQYKEWCK